MGDPFRFSVKPSPTAASCWVKLGERKGPVKPESFAVKAEERGSDGNVPDLGTWREARGAAGARGCSGACAWAAAGRSALRGVPLLSPGREERNPRHGTDSGVHADKTRFEPGNFRSGRRKGLDGRKDTCRPKGAGTQPSRDPTTCRLVTAGHLPFRRGRGQADDLARAPRRSPGCRTGDPFRGSRSGASGVVRGRGA